ncbi:AraC family transcriptional regulator [Flavobacterium selenitireducens]|uniref:AraC family transcriptional regulator n=1 Tax=Flavobacterium selenitireducens TaxID=2722704 RepID=UPI00168A8C41|nr:AraC family transcriptional regulator [Flavobacterium selenitireducens]MBD3581922.1 helix-turn-helix transcriptional regulator [Flavobacterium selenitireducens]
MKFNNIQSCHLGPEISPEQFIPEHFFLYLLKGSMLAFDGNKKYEMAEGDYCIARKNHLVRYTKRKNDGQFEKVIITFDAAFLQKFYERHKPGKRNWIADDSFIFVEDDTLIRNFIRSLEPYYNGTETLDETFADVKREELLLILLRRNPDLSGVFFNTALPEKIDLEAFMLKNFRFNVSLDRLAFLTGRSLSTFKRDFSNIFGTTPGQWLTQKRLEEAHFLIQSEKRKPSEIYLDLGFENLSHFSRAFKKRFGYAPNQAA